MNSTRFVVSCACATLTSIDHDMRGRHTATRSASGTGVTALRARTRTRHCRPRDRHTPNVPRATAANRKASRSPRTHKQRAGRVHVRMADGAHWLSDVLWASPITMLCSWLVWKLLVVAYTPKPAVSSG